MSLVEYLINFVIGAAGVFVLTVVVLAARDTVRGFKEEVERNGLMETLITIGVFFVLTVLIVLAIFGLGTFIRWLVPS